MLLHKRASLVQSALIVLFFAPHYGASTITFDQIRPMNSTTDVMGWAPESRGRGTIPLLWSCFATVFLGT
jgi:hypothetical protein